MPARPYGLSLLCLFSAAALYPQRFTRPYLYALPVILLANTHVLVFAASIALAAGYLYDITRKGFAANAHHYTALMLMGFGILLAILTVYPQPADIWMGLNHWIKVRAPLVFLKVLQQGLLPYLPGSYNENTGLPLMATRIVGVVVGLLGPGATLYALRGKKVPFMFLTACLLWLFYVLCYKYVMGFFRHFAYVPVFCLTALWLGNLSGPWRDPAASRFARGALGILLMLSIPTTVAGYVWDYRHDFSAGEATAAFIRAQHDEHRIIVTDQTAAAIMPFLPETTFWLSGSERFGTYSVWRKGSELDHTPMLTSLFDRIHAQFPDTSNLLLVTTMALTDPQRHGVRLIYQRDAGRESMWVYEFANARQP